MTKMIYIHYEKNPFFLGKGFYCFLNYLWKTIIKNIKYILITLYCEKFMKLTKEQKKEIKEQQSQKY